MRVLHLTTEFPPVIHGGLGTAVGGLAVASARAGLTVGVLLVAETGHATYGGAPPAGDAAGHAGRTTPARGGWGALALFRLAWPEALEGAVRLVRAWGPDVVHLHSFWLWPVARAIREQTGTPLVYTVHSLDRAEYELGGGPPECLSQWATQEAVIAAADRVVALSRSERALLARYHPAAGARVRTVGNGVTDCPAARRAIRRREGGGSPVVLFTGRFVARKGLGELLEAIPQVLTRAPRTRFVLAGGHRHLAGAEAERLWLPAALRAHRERIHFTGWLTPAELAAWYAAADILVVPSWYEPFGMVVLEGMLYGLAIAAARVGGPAAILAHGRTGLLFPPRDAGALARAIVRLVDDSPLRRRLGLAAAADVRRRWRWPVIVGRMRRVYEEAAGARPHLEAAVPAVALGPQASTAPAPPIGM